MFGLSGTNKPCLSKKWGGKPCRMRNVSITAHGTRSLQPETTYQLPRQLSRRLSVSDAMQSMLGSAFSGVSVNPVRRPT